jgi:hypothetical protein
MNKKDDVQLIIVVKKYCFKPIVVEKEVKNLNLCFFRQIVVENLGRNV